MSSANIGNINTYLALTQRDRLRGQALGRISPDYPPTVQILLQLKDSGGCFPVAQLEWELEQKYTDTFRGSTFRDALKKLRDNAFLELDGDVLSATAKITEKGLEQLALWD